MDEHELDDPELAAALRGHADRLVDPIDADAALAGVMRRADLRRRRRLTVGLGAAAATIVAVGALAVVTVGGDREVIRAPATQPTLDSFSGPTTPATATSTLPPPSVQATTTAATVTGPAVSPAPSTAPVVTTTSPPAPPTTRTFPSNGGSITVRLADGAISLDGPPRPTEGWTARIEDDGPDRVRVRFERGEQRSEIRVDLEDGELVPQTVES